MAKTRILYGLFLLAAVVFHSFYTGWFSFFLLVFAVLLPFFSLLVSLPAMLRAAYEAELPVRCFCGQSVQYRLLAHHAAKLPVSRCRLRLTVSDVVGGEARQQLIAQPIAKKASLAVRQPEVDEDRVLVVLQRLEQSLAPRVRSAPAAPASPARARRRCPWRRRPSPRAVR